jgi:hypothetical protein
MIYVYAILEELVADRVEARGIDEQPVCFERVGDLTAACTRHDAVPIRPTAQNVLRHERAVEQLMRGGTLLPARFGTTFDSDDVLHDVLSRHQAELIDALEQVRGCDELGVRILRPAQANRPDEGPPPHSGREYLLRRAAQERDDSEFLERAEAIHERLASLAKASNHRVLNTPSSLLSGAYLVARDRIHPFRELVNHLSTRHDDLRLLCTGPWPAYNFAPTLKDAEACHA